MSNSCCTHTAGVKHRCLKSLASTLVEPHPLMLLIGFAISLGGVLKGPKALYFISTVPSNS